ncbi:MAG: DUF882 domain-containing protein [Pseudaminobacter sp.]|nr:DUF882 domain-containing protein [Pseudaminobacter sp.]
MRRRELRGVSRLKAAGSRFANGRGRAVAAALFSVLLASCTSSTDPTLELGMTGYNAAGGSAATGDVAPQTVMSAEGDTALPEQVASVPAARPAEASATLEVATGEPTPQPVAVAENASAAPTADATQEQAAQPVATAEGVGLVAETAPSVETPPAENAVFVTAGAPDPQPIAPKKKSFLSSFFGASPAAAAPSPIKQPQAKPIIQLASASPAEMPVVLASAGADSAPDPLVSFGDDNALPGVRQSALFEIKRKSGIDDDSDVDLHEEEDGAPMLLASAAGLARLAPNGLLKQTDRVDVACLKPSLVRVLKAVERHYGKKMIVTSGYRSPSHNRRARGAKNSLHMYCAAVDVQIAGVSKWELAQFARSMPGRGGVGTYCHTESVHIDVGPERDWNWRCRRRK